MAGPIRPMPTKSPGVPGSSNVPRQYAPPVVADRMDRTPAQNAYGPSGSRTQALANPRVQQFQQNYSPAGGSGGPAPAPTQPMASRGGGGGGGGGGSMRDVDWFGKDSIFRTGAGGAQVSLQEQLAQLLFENQQGYQDIDRTRRDWTQQRERGSQRTGEDFAARGLSQSGLYWQGLQDLLKDYEDSAGQINLREQNLAQQLGGRDPLSRLKAPADVASAMAMDEGMEMGAQMASPMATQATPGGFTQDALFDQNYNALADVYGLLGQRGVGEGNRYQAGLNKMRAESAARSNQNIINTLGW